MHAVFHVVVHSISIHAQLAICIYTISGVGKGKASGSSMQYFQRRTCLSGTTCIIAIAIYIYISTSIWACPKAPMHAYSGR